MHLPLISDKDQPLNKFHIKSKPIEKLETVLILVSNPNEKNWSALKEKFPDSKLIWFWNGQKSASRLP